MTIDPMGNGVWHHFTPTNVKHTNTNKLVSFTSMGVNLSTIIWARLNAFP